MKLNFLAVAGLVAALGAGCAKYTPALSPTAQTNPESAYVFGRFSKSGTPNFGLVIEDIGRTKEYVVQFANGSSVRPFELEPGSYEITQFIAANIANEIIGRKQLSGAPFATAFRVDRGGAYYLGNFTGVYNSAGGKLVWKIEPVTDDFASAKEELVHAYPNFSRLRITRAFGASSR